MGSVAFDPLFFFYFRRAFVSLDRPTQLGDPDGLFRLVFVSGRFFVLLPHIPQRRPRRRDVPSDLLRNVAFKRIRMEAKGVVVPVMPDFPEEGTNGPVVGLFWVDLSFTVSSPPNRSLTGALPFPAFSRSAACSSTAS